MYRSRLVAGVLCAQVITGLSFLTFYSRAVEAPGILPATDVQPSSFCAKWSDVAGATEYRLDVFSPNEDFRDGDFTNALSWTGATNDFQVLPNAVLPGGAAATDCRFLASRGGAVDSSLCIPCRETGEWRFALGTPDIDPSDYNWVAVILMSDSAVIGDPADGAWQGYYVRFGDNADDRARLYRKPAGEPAIIGIFDTPSFSNGGLRDGLGIRVTRDDNGVFRLWYDSGFTNCLNPANFAGSLTNTAQSASAWFGVGTHFSGGDPARRVYFDNLALGGSPVFLEGYSNRVVAGTTCLVNDLMDENDYFYRVRAVDVNGAVSSNSAVAGVYTPRVPEPVANPSNDCISLTGVTTNTFDISWSGGDGECTLIICREGDYPTAVPQDRAAYSANRDFRAAPFLGDGGVVYSGPAGGMFTLSGLEAGHRYYLRVYNFNGVVPGTENYRQAAPGQANKRTTPGAPEGLEATDGVFFAKIRLTWSPTLGATSYRVYRDVENLPDPADQIASVGDGATAYEDVAAEMGVTYFYWVKAYNGSLGVFSAPDTGRRFTGSLMWFK